MKCIYLDKNGHCLAQPSNVDGEYKPEEEILKRYCKNIGNMLACPRMKIYHAYLTTSGKK